MLQVVVRLVGGEAKAAAILTCFALERKIAEATGRAAPRDAHVVLNTFETRERELKAEWEAIARGPHVPRRSRGWR